MDTWYIGATLTSGLLGSLLTWLWCWWFPTPHWRGRRLLAFATFWAVVSAVAEYAFCIDIPMVPPNQVWGLAILGSALSTPGSLWLRGLLKQEIMERQLITAMPVEGLRNPNPEPISADAAGNYYQAEVGRDTTGAWVTVDKRAPNGNQLGAWLVRAPVPPGPGPCGLVMFNSGTTLVGGLTAGLPLLWCVFAIEDAGYIEENSNGPG